MPKPFALVLALLLLLAPAAPAAEHVVLVSIDGFAAYHLTDETLLLPNIRALIAEGTWAAASQTVFPSVTHPSHTTIVTGVEPRVHGVLNNSMTNRETGETFHPTNKRRTELVRVPTLFDAAKKKGLATASFFWPETYEDPSIDFNIPEVFTPDHRGEISAVPPAVIRELQDSDIPIELYFKWFGTEQHPAADVLLADSAAHIIKTRKPGLLAIHLLITDQRQHDYGPHHYRAKEALTRADDAVGRLRQAVADAGIADETVFIVGADHGFHSVYRELNIRSAFERAGLLDRIELRGGGWSLWIRLKDNFDASRDEPKLEAVFAELLKHPNIQRVIRPADLHALGQPRFEEDPHAIGHYAVIPDIDTYLTVAPGGDGKMELRPRTAPSHSHGYLPEHPRMRPSLVISGAGIRRGATIGLVRNHDIATTVARILGLDMPGVEGRVLEEAFAQ